MKPRPDQFATRAEYSWALKQWRRKHGGSLLSLLLIATFFGALTGSTLLLLGLMAFAIVAHAIARSRP